jgi:bacterioferritin
MVILLVIFYLFFYKGKEPLYAWLFTFIENQEEYHKQKLMEFFKLMNRLTVGDLKKKDA